MKIITNRIILEVAPLIATADRRRLIEYKLSIQGAKLILFFKKLKI